MRVTDDGTIALESCARDSNGNQAVIRQRKRGERSRQGQAVG